VAKVPHFAGDLIFDHRGEKPSFAFEVTVN
jgi:hypothetical protein